MTEYPAARNQNRCPTHPGAILREVVDAIGKSKTEIADALGISRQHLYDIMKEKKPVSPETAVRIGKLAGNGGAVWLRLQCEHDIWLAEREVDISQIPTFRDGERRVFGDAKLGKRPEIWRIEKRVARPESTRRSVSPAKTPHGKRRSSAKHVKQG